MRTRDIILFLKIDFFIFLRQDTSIISMLTVSHSRTIAFFSIIFVVIVIVCRSR
jgi:hypothetical protein